MSGAPDDRGRATARVASADAVMPIGRPTSVSSLALAREGARDMTPMVVGVVPFALALGAMIGVSSVGALAGLASAALILAGAAQLATIEMLDAGVSPAIVIVSALLINLRILLYGMSLAPWFTEAPLWRRLLLAIPVIDQTHFVCVPRFERGDLDHRGRVAYYTGAGAWLVTAWIAAQTAAVVLGAGLPASARLDMAAPLALVGLLAKSTGTMPSAVAAGVAVLIGSLAVGLPFHSATLVATSVAIAAGVGVAHVARRGGTP